MNDSVKGAAVAAVLPCSKPRHASRLPIALLAVAALWCAAAQAQAPATPVPAGTVYDVKPGDSFAGFKIADVSWNRVKLVSANGTPMEMAIQSQMKRLDEGEWSFNASPEPTVNSSAEPTATGGGTNESASSGSESDILKKLMQKREEELKNEAK